jgi:hypothetical protein
MKTKMISVVAVLVLILLGAYFFRQQAAPPVSDPAAQEALAIGQTADQVPAEAAAPHQDLLPDPSQMPEAKIEAWGVILRDKVKLVSGADLVKDAKVQAIAVLNTGDVVSIDDTGSDTDTAVRVSTRSGDGQEGWIAKDKLIDLTKSGMQNDSFLGSTMPISDLIASNVDDAEDYIKKYQDLISDEFIKRAMKNPNEEIAMWAKQVNESMHSPKQNQ